MEQLQFWLNTLPSESSIPSVTVWMRVRQRNRHACPGLQQDGLSGQDVVGRATTPELTISSAASSLTNGRPNAYRAQSQWQGSSRAERPAGAVLSDQHGVSQPEHPDRRWEIRQARQRQCGGFQSYFGLTSDGVVT